MSTSTRDLLAKLSEAIFTAEVADHIPHDLLLEVADHLAPAYSPPPGVGSATLRNIPIRQKQTSSCHDDCLGWSHFNVGTDREGIERCDDCKRYASDTQAANAHREHCSCGMECGEPAVQCSGCGYSVDDVGPCRVNADERLVCERCASEAILDARAGRCGLGAEWGVQTWAVNSAAGLYICDLEDSEGTYELVLREIVNGDEYTYESLLASKSPTQLLSLASDIISERS